MCMKLNGTCILRCIGMSSDRIWIHVEVDVVFLIHI